MAKPNKKKSLLEKKKELERVANEVEQHFKKVSVWQPSKEDREKTEKEWPDWCQRFDKLILRLVEIISSSPEFYEELKDDKRYDLLRDYYQGLCLRRNGEPATPAQTSSGWVNCGFRERPLEYNEVDHLMGFVRTVVRRILVGSDETQLSPAWQEFLQKTEGAKEGEDRYKKATVQEESSNVLRRSGDFWMVVYEGLNKHLKHCDGLVYIAILLSQPRVFFTAFDLYNAAHRVETGKKERFYEPLEDVENRKKVHNGTGKDEIFDLDYYEEVRKDLTDLQHHKEEAEKKNDIAAAEQAQEKIDKILNYCSPPPRGKEDSKPPKWADDFEKARQTVCKAIRKTISRIEGEHANLALHLDRFISLGSTLAYQPDREICWDT